MNSTVIKLAYLLGVSDAVLVAKYDKRYDRSEFTGVEAAQAIRAYCRTRQVILYHLTDGPKISTLPDSLRTYCPGDYFDNLQSLFTQLYYPYAFVNELTDRIMELLPGAMEELAIPYATTLGNLLFFWQKQNKQSLLGLSGQYHSRKFYFPLKVFIPKPSTFGPKLGKLFDRDSNLWSSPPIKLALPLDPNPYPKFQSQPASQPKPRQQRGGSAPVYPPHRQYTPAIPQSIPAAPQDTPEAPVIQHEEQPPVEEKKAHYIDQTFSPHLIHHSDGVQISYVDFDNTPEFVTAQLCSNASLVNQVKIFYDDRPWGHVNLFENIPNVELIYVERLLAQKSLVDAGIITVMLSDLYEDRLDQAVLYSSDSDFYMLSKQFLKKRVDFSVVGLADRMAEAYIERLSTDTNCYILSEKSVTPAIDPALVKALLLRNITNGPVQGRSLKELTETILSAMAESEYHALMAKDVSSIIEQNIGHISLQFVNGQLQAVFMSEE